MISHRCTARTPCAHRRTKGGKARQVKRRRIEGALTFLALLRLCVIAKANSEMSFQSLALNSTLPDIQLESTIEPRGHTQWVQR
jgi:hypothetical protein